MIYSGKNVFTYVPGVSKKTVNNKTCKLVTTFV